MIYRYIGKYYRFDRWQDLTPHCCHLVVTSESPHGTPIIFKKCYKNRIIKIIKTLGVILNLIPLN